MIMVIPVKLTQPACLGEKVENVKEIKPEGNPDNENWLRLKQKNARKA